MNSIFQIVILIVLALSIRVKGYRSSGLRVMNRIHSKFGMKYSTQLSAKATYKVTIQHEGKDRTIDIREDVSILEAALDAGIELPYDCKMGVCLTCPSKIVSGKVDQTGSTLDESVLEQGYALTCCVFPRSDMVIKSIEEDELVSAQFSDRKS